MIKTNQRTNICKYDTHQQKKKLKISKEFPLIMGEKGKHHKYKKMFYYKKTL